MHAKICAPKGASWNITLWEKCCQTPRTRVYLYPLWYIMPDQRGFSFRSSRNFHIFGKNFLTNLLRVLVLSGFIGPSGLSSPQSLLPTAPCRPKTPPPGASRSARRPYQPRIRGATCFLRLKTPGIHTPPSDEHSMPKVRFTMRGLPSTMNMLPSAMMSVTSRSANS